MVSALIFPNVRVQKVGTANFLFKKINQQDFKKTSHVPDLRFRNATNATDIGTPKGVEPNADPAL